MPDAEIRTFLASDGARLAYRHYMPAADPPLMRIVALHGIQSHSGWYDYSHSALRDVGAEVFAMDRRGSGLNEENRGHAPHAQRLINDVVQFLTPIRRREQAEPLACPLILLGVSWGGKLAAAITATRPDLVDALAMLYPGIYTRFRPRWDQRLRLGLAEWLGIRRRKVPIPLKDPALFTAEPRWQEFIRQDPLALHDVTVGFLQSSLELDRLADAAPPRLTCPVLLMLAGKDRIIDNTATRAFYQRIAATNRRLIEYPEAQHTLEFEPFRAQFVTDLQQWLKEVRIAFPVKTPSPFASPR